MVADQHQTQGREFEIKLEFDPADAARLVAHSLLRAAPQEQNLVSIYFDTPGETLHKAGVYVRIRDINGRRVQTIKAAKSDGGLFDRFEWEREVKGRTPNFSGVARGALKSLFTPDLRASLRPVFETRVTRSIYRLTYEASDIELLSIGARLRPPPSTARFQSSSLSSRVGIRSPYQPRPRFCR